MKEQKNANIGNILQKAALKWILNKSMPARKIGKMWKFKISEVDEWVKNGGAVEKLTML